MTVPLWKTIHDDKPVVDLHIHPAMNRLVIKQNLGLRYIVSRSFNPFAVRASWPRLQDGGYGASLPSTAPRRQIVRALVGSRRWPASLR